MLLSFRIGIFVVLASFLDVKITNEDEKFLHLTGERGTVIVNKKDIISMKNVTPL